MMLTGSTTQVLHTFRQILSDIEVVAGPKSGGLILAKIKNAMSDRHIVEKNFNSPRRFQSFVNNNKQLFST